MTFFLTCPWRAPFRVSMRASSAVICGAACLAGCSPALNWRTVALTGPDAGSPSVAGRDGGGGVIQVLLPCKPEQASRPVELAGQGVTLSMIGCQADGATFAISHAALPDPAQANAALAHWRAAVMARAGVVPPPAGSVDASGAQPAALPTTPFVPRGALALPGAVRTAAAGRAADGASVYLQGVWFARAVGTQVHLYHAVVYSAKPRIEVADTFFEGLVLP